MTTKFYPFPFAIDGDVATIPDTTQPSGTVSYQAGFGGNYSLPFPADSSALPVPRTSTNQLFLDITANIQDYYARGVPRFITASDNLGTAWSYDANARARYTDGKTYVSAVNSNTSTPGVDDKWKFLQDTGEAVYIYGVVFDGAVNDGDLVAYDAGSGTFKQAIFNGTNLQNALGIAVLTQKSVQTLGLVSGSSLTAGSVYYLSKTTPGTYTLVAPAPSLNALQVGVAISATQIYLSPQFVNLNNVLWGTVSLTTNQTIIAGAGATLLHFNNVLADPYGWWDPVNFVFRPGLVGKFLACATVATSTATVGDNGLFSFSTSSGARLEQKYITAAQPYSLGGSMILFTNDSADTLYLQWDNAGVSNTIVGSGQFSIQYLGA